jgi:hypothetical protein
VFEGELYHLVKDKNATGFNVVFNQPTLNEPLKNSPVKNLAKMSPRREELLQVHEKRFEVFNKDPVHITTVPRVKNVIFRKMLPRSNQLFGAT